MTRRDRNKRKSNTRSQRPPREESRRKRRRRREKRRRRRTFLPYIGIFILAIICIFFITRKVSHNVDRTIAKVEKAIKTDDTSFMSEHTDRLDIIFEVLKKSYSDEEAKQDDFIRNNFKNLKIEVTNTLDIEGGKEVSLKVSNVNYVEAYDRVKTTEEELRHEAYMKELSKDGADTKETESKVFLKKKLFGYDIYESREFINGILGRALDLVK